MFIDNRTNVQNSCLSIAYTIHIWFKVFSKALAAFLSSHNFLNLFKTSTLTMITNAYQITSSYMLGKP
jgi:hypothetical protein